MNRAGWSPMRWRITRRAGLPRRRRRIARRCGCSRPADPDAQSRCRRRRPGAARRGRSAVRRGDRSRAALCVGALQPRRCAVTRSADQGRDPARSRRACAIEPEHYEAHRALALLWLAEGERGPRARSFRPHLRAAPRRRPQRHGGEVADRGDARQARCMMRISSAILSRRRRDGQRFETLARIYARWRAACRRRR